MGRRALPVAAHNRKPDELRLLVERVKGEFGRLDILVNNAATNPVFGPLIDVEERAFDVIMNTNLKGYFLLSQMAAKMMIAQGGDGQIINISSIGGTSPEKGLGVYSISKAAVNMLTKVLAVELGDHNIRVNALAPGVIKTRFSRALWDNELFMAEALKQTPLKRIAEPEEVARMALALASDAGSFMTGQVIVMDGGLLI
jgi:NAD(P)-dependent dehydrogenase (short-subunit alcohol dehydrogenase family)